MPLKTGTDLITSKKLTKSEADDIYMVPYHVIIKSGEVYRSTHEKNLPMFLDRGYKLDRYI